mmetsp:Transcript_7783/g.15584  ORF Transcript_7783/g.15584 Transcript_7783/m.15584 type:complete len:248 (-) Transcript_7783:1063-1806(-)
MFEMASFAKNLTSGSSSLTFSRSLPSSFMRHSSSTNLPTFLQHLTASMRRLTTLSSHISRMLGQSLFCSSSVSSCGAKMLAPSSNTALCWNPFSVFRSSKTRTTYRESHSFEFPSNLSATSPIARNQSVRINAQLSVAQFGSWPPNSRLNASSPKLAANLGNKERIEWRTRQFLSRDKFTIKASTPDCWSVPITSMRELILLIMRIRTLLFSSCSSNCVTVGRTSSNARAWPRGAAMSMSTPANSIR